ncbi:MAG: hypothetical protein Q8P57_00005, partial [Candidatus Pacearchaeota archaeon]|nr:hypothetical protein [Candidatus Pacearchaeota archaeon]
MKYSRYLPELKRRENWNEIVERNMTMHIKKFPFLEDEIRENYKYVFEKKVLPSMRAMQFGGKPIEITESRIFNCAYAPVDDWRIFQEVMFLLLGGTGFGYSVQFHHIEKLPEIRKPLKRKRKFLIDDSIVGWSDAIKVLMKAYFFGTSNPEFDYCLDPKTKILMSDLSWKEIKDININDEIVGFEEHIKNSRAGVRKLQKSKVEKITTIKQPRRKIITNKGTIISSTLHGFLIASTRKEKGFTGWKQAKDLKIGDKIKFLVKPWEKENSFESGWLSGIFDGEGWTMGRGCLGIGQNDGIVLEEILKLLKERDFKCSIYKTKSGCSQVYINGGFKEGMRLLGSIRPKRLLSNLKENYWIGKNVNGKGSQHAEILEIEEIEEGDVIGIKTTTSTLISEGFLTHNSDIRSKGAMLITSGGKAPGPQPLKDCIHNVRKILESKVEGEKLSPFEAHSIICHIADAVLSGGIRRASLVSLFSIDDEEMLTCKRGNWWELNPQLGRANNSATVLRHRFKRSNFNKLWEAIEQSRSGEPGIYLSHCKDSGFNPCFEASLRPFSFCNLTEINVSNIEEQNDFNERCRAASFIGTLQASYTDFHYLRECWKKATEKDSLLGVSMTGIASGKVLKINLQESANIVLEENEKIAKLIGINKAARTTLGKPSGTTSLVLGTSSGIHAWHNDYYIRRLRVGKNEAIYKYLKEKFPKLVENDYFKPLTQAVISIPIKSPEGAITRQESPLDLLSRVKSIYENWILPGHRDGQNTHNQSCTISLKDDEWKEVGEWLWKNKDCYNGISFL